MTNRRHRRDANVPFIFTCRGSALRTDRFDFFAAVAMPASRPDRLFCDLCLVRFSVPTAFIGSGAL